MAREVNRRRFLITAAGAALVGCSSGSVAQPSDGQDGSVPTPEGGGSSGDANGPDTNAPPVDAGDCTSAAGGDGGGVACGLPLKELRVANGARLGVGEAVIVSVDNTNAAIVLRDALGFYALSAACTHDCCTISLCKDAACASPVKAGAKCLVPSPVTLPTVGRTFLCPCHGSEFASDGTVVQGPAAAPLTALALRLDGNDAVVDFSTPVSATRRVGGADAGADGGSDAPPG